MFPAGLEVLDAPPIFDQQGVKIDARHFPSLAPSHCAAATTGIVTEK
jgi:hypothetical protein